MEASTFLGLRCLAAPAMFGGLTLPLLVACTGGQTGDEFHEGGSTGGGGNCDETLHDVEGTNKVVDALGFSASDILAFVEGESRTTLHWSDLPKVRFVPGPGETELTIAVSHAGGTRHVVRTPKPSSDEVASGRGATLANPSVAYDDPCEDALEMDVVVEARTADGGLDETWSVKLRASSPLSAKFVHGLDLNAFDGSFEVTTVVPFDHANPGGTELVQAEFAMEFTGFGTAGAFSAFLKEEIEIGGASGIGFDWIRFAEWPLSSECADGTVLPLGQEYGGVSADTVVAALNDASPLPWTWQDETETQLNLTLRPTTEHACTTAADDGPGVSVTFEAEAELATDDGRLALTLPGVVRRSREVEGEPTELQLNFASNISGTPLNEAFPGLSVNPDDFDTVSVFLAASYLIHVEGAEAVHLGLQLLGWVDGGCSSSVPDAPCVGQDTLLEQGRTVDR